jgi:hypothetical protein
MAQKAWMKDAKSFKWTKDGCMTMETFKMQEARFNKCATLTQLRAAIPYGSEGAAHTYAHLVGKKSYFDLTPTEMNDCLYAIAWCKAYRKNMSDYLGANFGVEQLSVEL